MKIYFIKIYFYKIENVNDDNIMFKIKYIIMNRLKYESVLEKNLNTIIVDNSEIINERFILVAENWSYKDIFTKIALLRKRKLPKISIKKSWLKIAWLIEGVLYLFGKRRFMTKALINSLCDKKKISGKRITHKISFKYSSIDTYLEQHASIRG